MSNTVQILLAIYLIDRLFILRKRYILSIDAHRPNRYGRGYWALWILCKSGQSERYTREFGRRLFSFHYGKQLK